MQQIYFWGRRVARRAAPVLAMGGLVGSLLGAPAWAQAPAWVAATAGSPQQLSGNSEVQGTAVDASGNVLVVGYFSGQVAFGTTMLTSAGGTDLFVAKWVPGTGTWAWAQRGGGSDDDQGNALAVSGNRTYVVGSIRNNLSNGSAVTFGGAGGPAGTATQAGASATLSNDLVVVAYTDNGTSATLAWTQVGGGTNDDHAYGVAASGSRVYVTGHIYNNQLNTSQVLLGGAGTVAGTVVQAGASTTASSDLLLAQYLDAGASATLSWAQVGGGKGIDLGLGVAVSGSRVYVAGGIVNNLSDVNAVLFGGAGTVVGAAKQYGATATSSGDMLLACYTDNSVAGGAGAGLNWTQIGGGTSYERAQAVAVNGNRVYVGGYLYNSSADDNTAVFGGAGTTPGTTPQYGASPTASSDWLLAQYTDNGATAALGWTQVGGGISNDNLLAIAVQGSTIYATGSINNNLANGASVVFGGAGTAGGTVAQAGTSSGYSLDIVVARYTDNTATGGTGATANWLQLAGGTGADQGMGLAVSGTGVYVGSFVSGYVSTFGPAASNIVAGSLGRRAAIARLADAATAGTWQAVGTANNGGTAITMGTAVDASGNVFVTGYFTGQYTLGTTVLSSAGSTDLFVAKYVPSTGTWAWAQSGGGALGDAGLSIAVSGSRVYVAGYLSNSASNFANVLLGGTGPGTNTVVQHGASSTANTDMLLLAYTDNGPSATLNWTQVGGGTDGDAAYGVAVNGTNVYVAGYLTNSTTNSRSVLFGGTGAVPGTATQHGATATASLDIFVAKYTDNGPTATLGWTQVGGGTSADNGLGVAVSGSNVYVVGDIVNNGANANAVVFGGAGTAVGTATQYGASSPTVVTNPDIILAKYIDNGTSATLGWTQSAGGSDFDRGHRLAASGNSIYLVGTITNNRANDYNVLFGAAGTTPGTVAQAGTHLFSNPSTDIVLAKYTDNGPNATVRWTQVGGGYGADLGFDVAVSGSSIYLVGYQTNDLTNTNNVVFGGAGLVAGTRPQPGASSISSQDVLVAKYTDNGGTATLNWTQVGGGRGEDRGYSVAVAGSQVLVGGYCLPPATFGSFALSGLATQSLLGHLTDGASLATVPGPASSPTQLQLYPNPAARRATLAGVAANTPVQVLDALGRVVLATRTDAAGTIALALPAGIYVVRTSTQAARLAVE